MGSFFVSSARMPFPAVQMNGRTSPPYGLSQLPSPLRSTYAVPTAVRPVSSTAQP